MNIQRTHRNLQIQRTNAAIPTAPQSVDASAQPSDKFQASEPEPPSMMKAALGGAAVGAFLSGAAVMVMAEAVGAFSYMGGGGGSLGAVVAGAAAYGGVCGAVLAAVNREHL